MAQDVASEAMSEKAAGETAAGEDGAAAPAGRPDRVERLRLQTVRNMVLSLALICAGVFVLYFLFDPYAFTPDDGPGDAGPTVEYRVEAATAARVAPYELLVPVGLSGEWRATSVRYEPQGEFGATWRLGLVNPDERYAALAQADGAAADFVASITQDAQRTGAVQRVDGRDWARYEGPKYDALVLREPDVTTVVFGTAPFDQLARLATALQPETERG